MTRLSGRLTGIGGVLVVPPPRNGTRSGSLVRRQNVAGEVLLALTTVTMEVLVEVPICVPKLTGATVCDSAVAPQLVDKKVVGGSVGNTSGVAKDVL